MREPQSQPWPKKWTSYIYDVLTRINMGASGTNKKIINMANGSASSQEGCTVQQMEDHVMAAIGDNVSKSPPMIAATTAALPANTRTADVLLADANGEFPTIDGVPPVVNQDYLVKDEGGGASHINNGIYTLTIKGTAGTKWELTRRHDMEGGEGASGAMCPIASGTGAGDTTFKCINNIGSDVVNTDALEFWWWGQTTDHDNLKNVTANQHHNEAHVLDVSGPHTGLLPSDEVEIAVLDTPTYNLLSELINTNLSAGLISGASITDSGSGEIDVAAGTGLIRSSDSEVAPLLALNTPTATNFGLTDQKLNYIYVDYNGGTPQIAATITRLDINDNTEFCIGSVFRDGNTLHINPNGRSLIGDMPKWIEHRWEEVEGLSRAFGLAISETGTRNVALTAGEMYNGVNESIIGAFDSNPGGAADTFSYWYLLNSVWTKIATQAAIDNLQYNDVSTPGSEVLATLGAAKYGVHWVYQCSTGRVDIVYGQGNYNLNQAQAAQPPSSLPAILDSRFTMLVGKIIILKSAASFTEILSAFDVTFTGTVAANHNELGGLVGDSPYTHSDQGTSIADTPEFAGMKLTPRTPAPAHSEGLIYYDDDLKAFTAYNDHSNVALQIGEEIWIRGKNDQGAQIIDGNVVYISGGVAGPPSIPELKLAKADAEVTSCGTIAMVTEPTIADQATGIFTSYGIVRGLDTSSGGVLDTGSENWTQGTELFLSAAVAGAMTKTLPASPNFYVRVGWVLRQHATEGMIFVNIKTVQHADKIYIDDAGVIITATDVEGALQENRGLIDSALQNLVEDTTPQLGGALDLNEKAITMNPAPAGDHGNNGPVATFTAGENLVFGDVCYHKQSDDKMYKMDADAEATTDGFCVMALATINANDPGIFALPGCFVRDDSWSWTVDNTKRKLYASTTPGNPTETAPAGSGDIVRIIGYAKTATVIFFNPDASYVEVP